MNKNSGDHFGVLENDGMSLMFQAAAILSLSVNKDSAEKAQFYDSTADPCDLWPLQQRMQSWRWWINARLHLSPPLLTRLGQAKQTA